MHIEIHDREGVIKAPHASLERLYPLEELERALYEALKEEKQATLSKLWRRFDCHLWEIVEALRRLKDKGLVEERDLPAYTRP
jgi:predicted transcriptional regulator